MTNPAPTILDRIDELNRVTSFRINFGDILMQIVGANPQMVHDYVAFQTIEQSGWIYAPDTAHKVELAKWFINRNCSVDFSINPASILNRYQRWRLRKTVKALNASVRLLKVRSMEL